MRLSKVTSALIAAGIGAGLATGYTHLDNLSVGAAQAATQPVAVAAAQAATRPVAAPATATSSLPDFTGLVDRAGASVVNISTFHTNVKGAADLGDIDEDSPYYEFFKRFGGIPNGPGMQPQQPRALPLLPMQLCRQVLSPLLFPQMRQLILIQAPSL